MRPTLLYLCSVFLAVVIPAKAGIQVSVFLKYNGFPITTSGMTTNAFPVELLGKGTYAALH